MTYVEYAWNVNRCRKAVEPFKRGIKRKRIKKKSNNNKKKSLNPTVHSTQFIEHLPVASQTPTKNKVYILDYN